MIVALQLVQNRLAEVRGELPAQTQLVAERLTPTSFLQRSPVGDILTVIQYLAYVFAPELAPDHLKLGGVIQPDIVPDDRLK